MQCFHDYRRFHNYRRFCPKVSEEWAIDLNLSAPPPANENLAPPPMYIKPTIVAAIIDQTTVLCRLTYQYIIMTSRA